VTKPQQKSTIRLWRIAIWIGFASVFLFLYYSRAEFFGSGFRDWAATSVLMGYSLYLLVGAVRGFTLIPATHLILLGIPLFPPAPLFFLSLAGILISSTTVYYFSESLHLSEYFERKHREKILKIQAALRRNPIAIVTTWSFFPLVPTDLICYACGVMRIPFGRFFLGVFLGEGAICALYVFGGKSLMEILKSAVGI